MKTGAIICLAAIAGMAVNGIVNKVCKAVVKKDLKGKTFLNFDGLDRAVDSLSKTVENKLRLTQEEDENGLTRDEYLDLMILGFKGRMLEVEEKNGIVYLDKVDLAKETCKRIFQEPVSDLMEDVNDLIEEQKKELTELIGTLKENTIEVNLPENYDIDSKVEEVISVKFEEAMSTLLVGTSNEEGKDPLDIINEIDERIEEVVLAKVKETMGEVVCGVNHAAEEGLLEVVNKKLEDQQKFFNNELDDLAEELEIVTKGFSELLKNGPSEAFLNKEQLKLLTETKNGLDLISKNLVSDRSKLKSISETLSKHSKGFKKLTEEVEKLKISEKLVKGNTSSNADKIDILNENISKKKVVEKHIVLGRKDESKKVRERYIMVDPKDGDKKCKQFDAELQLEERDNENIS